MSISVIVQLQKSEGNFQESVVTFHLSGVRSLLLLLLRRVFEGSCTQAPSWFSGSSFPSHHWYAEITDMPCNI